MQSRTKIFLTFAVICIVPLLLISVVNFVGNLKSNESLLKADLEDELAHISHEFDSLLRKHQAHLQEVAGNSSLRQHLAQNQFSSDNELPSNTRTELAKLVQGPMACQAVAAFSPDKQLRVVAEPSPSKGNEVLFRTKDFPPDYLQPDSDVWTTSETQPKCRIVLQSSQGKTLRCTSPIFSNADQLNTRGALVADLPLDSLTSASARRTELPISEIQGSTTPAALVIVIDDSGTIIHHTNDALKHQSVNTSMPYFASLATSMIAGEGGTKFFKASDGDEWLVSYAPLMPQRLSLAVARNYSLFTRSTRFLGWISIITALVLGTGAAVLLSTLFLRKTKSIERVAEGVGEIAKGKLDHRIDLRSSDDLKPLADNVGLVTQQLREQLLREAESRQFQSFVRLSAVLTHDLKNAIETLSLIVGNMERHADNEEFRADAMASLSGATAKLKALVARLSNPVTTLSGEHKRPRPVDLVPMLNRVVAMTAEPVSDRHEVKLDLPESAFALVDIERMEKVAENLIINALEAMTKKSGILTVAAGKMDDGKIFFSVADTGEGMNQRFIAERLFHPFATTKRNGVGLGLYTCREVVRANGGAIEVQSTEGAGTTFRVVLPSPPIEDAV